MRAAFINTLIELADTDSDIWLIIADMGFGVVEPFAEKFPERYINVGVAEQSMVGIAAGLAQEGKKVFCYSIGNFPTMRCLEQIRNDVCYHNLPVCIVSGGAGLWYGSLGMTHWALEDIAVMRSLPNMAVVSPATVEEIRPAIIGIHHQGTPCYLRMTRTINDRLLGLQKGVAPHYDIVFFTTGGQMLANALATCEQLSTERLTVRVANISELKPLSEVAISDTATNAKLVVTIEEHSRIGGLGSAVAEVLAGMRQHPPLVRLGTRDEYPSTAMSYDELLKFHKLDTDSIVKEVLDALR